MFDLYRKLTNSGRYLNFFSNHPIEHKKGVVMNLFDRTLWLSHPNFQEKNMVETINILINNGYPLQLIFSTINNRIKYLSTSGIKQHPKEERSSNNKQFFTIPYVKNISENFKRVAKKYNLNLAFSTTNSFSNFIKTGKDRLSVSSHCNVVYRIDCNDCEANYVGQTKRRLNTRIRKHLNDIKKSTGTLSVVSDHRLKLNHDFNWDEVRILDKEPSWKKRIVSEMIHIKKQKCGINKHSDTEFLPENYLPIINNFLTT